MAYIDTKIANLKSPVSDKSSACVYLCKFNYERGRPSAHCGCGKSFSYSSSCQPFRCVPQREHANNGSDDTDRLTTPAQSGTFRRGVNLGGRRITTQTTSVRTPTGGPSIATTGKETVEVQTSTEELPLKSEERDVDLEGSGEVSEIAEEEGSANGEEEWNLARQSNKNPSHMDENTSAGRQRTRRELSYQASFAGDIAEGQFIKQVYGKGCDCTCLNFTCNCADSEDEDEPKCRELPTWICRPGTLNRIGMHSVFTRRLLFNQPFNLLTLNSSKNEFLLIGLPQQFAKMTSHL